MFTVSAREMAEKGESSASLPKPWPRGKVLLSTVMEIRQEISSMLETLPEESVKLWLLIIVIPAITSALKRKST